MQLGIADVTPYKYLEDAAAGMLTGDAILLSMDMEKH